MSRFYAKSHRFLNLSSRDHNPYSAPTGEVIDTYQLAKQIRDRDEKIQDLAQKAQAKGLPKWFVGVD